MDVEDAVFGAGPYKLIPEYQHLALNSVVFRDMSPNQRLAAVKQFNKVNISISKQNNHN